MVKDGNGNTANVTSTRRAGQRCARRNVQPLGFIQEPVIPPSDSDSEIYDFELEYGDAPARWALFLESEGEDPDALKTDIPKLRRFGEYLIKRGLLSLYLCFHSED